MKKKCFIQTIFNLKSYAIVFGNQGVNRHVMRGYRTQIDGLYGKLSHWTTEYFNNERTQEKKTFCRKLLQETTLLNNK